MASGLLPIPQVSGAQMPMAPGEESWQGELRVRSRAGLCLGWGHRARFLAQGPVEVTAVAGGDLGCLSDGNSRGRGQQASLSPHQEAASGWGRESPCKGTWVSPGH